MKKTIRFWFVDGIGEYDPGVEIDILCDAAVKDNVEHILSCYLAIEQRESLFVWTVEGGDKYGVCCVVCIDVDVDAGVIVDADTGVNDADAAGGKGGKGKMNVVSFDIVK